MKTTSGSLTDTHSDHRRFPRIHHISPQEIVPLASGVQFGSRLIVTKNLSASGLCFTSSLSVQPGSSFLIYLNSHFLKEIGSQEHWLQSGNYFLARAVWLKKLPDASAFEIGARFVDRACCDEKDLSVFTDLINLKMMENLNTKTQDSRESVRPAKL